MKKYENMTKKDLRIELQKLYIEIEDILLTDPVKTAKAIPYDREILLEECINIENVINSINKVNVLNTELGFDFYILPRNYITDKGEQITLGTKIMIYKQGKGRDSVNFKLPNNWKHIELSGSLFQGTSNLVTVQLRDINQLDFNSAMMNNMARISIVTSVNGMSKISG